MKIISNKFQELKVTLDQFEAEASNSINAAAEMIATAFSKGNKMLTCGNGGSASDAQHFAAEFVNSFSKTLKRKALPALSLNSDSSVLTAIANDTHFAKVFSRQVEAVGKPGDVLVVFTTSGNSENCINALMTAKQLELNTIVFSQKNRISLTLSNIVIAVPSINTQIIQECHIVAYHLIADLVEKYMFTELND